MHRRYKHRRTGGFELSNSLKLVKNYGFSRLKKSANNDLEDIKELKSIKCRLKKIRKSVHKYLKAYFDDVSEEIEEEIGLLKN